jgi:hypothetical protein
MAEIPSGEPVSIVNLGNIRASSGGAKVVVLSPASGFIQRINHITLRQTCCALAFLRAAHSDAIYINCISLESSEKKRDEGILSRMRREKKREVVMQIERV